jgi:ubiquinone/menaquinone biosynthesis C-methylase UbiE
MATESSWQWDESVPINFDFGDWKVVAEYEEWHRRFRDIDRENEVILERLDVKPGQIVADFGCGTGAFARAAANRCGTVYAIDLSAAMLDYLQWKAKEEGLANIVCRPGGFLTYVHDGPLFDAIHTSLALHHLPDFWKQKALNRLAAMLKPGGMLHLMDVIFIPETCDANIDAWIAEMESTAGPEVAERIRAHVRKEFSTYAWIMEGLLERAGFRFDCLESITGSVLANYFCIRT